MEWDLKDVVLEIGSLKADLVHILEDRNEKLLSKKEQVALQILQSLISREPYDRYQSIDVDYLARKANNAAEYIVVEE